jgi:hypothetical protein
MLYSLPMSQEEVDAAIGKLVREKTQAQTQFTALMLEIRRHAELISQAGGALSNAGIPDSEKVGIQALDKAIEAGGLDKLKADTDKMLALRKRVLELQAAAKEMGLE